MIKFIGRILKIHSRNTASIEFNSIVYNIKQREKYSKRRRILINFSSTFLRVGNIVSVCYIGKISKLKSWYLLKIIR
ncbi:hypothetical protein [Candidatus Vidania fulgoroideorum]